MKKWIGYLQIMVGIIIILMALNVIVASSEITTNSGIDTWSETFADNVAYISKHVEGTLTTLGIVILMIGVLFILQGILNVRNKN